MVVTGLLCLGCALALLPSLAWPEPNAWVAVAACYVVAVAVLVLACPELLVAFGAAWLAGVALTALFSGGLDWPNLGVGLLYGSLGFAGWMVVLWPMAIQLRVIRG